MANCFWNTAYRFGCLQFGGSCHHQDDYSDCFSGGVSYKSCFCSNESKGMRYAEENSVTAFVAANNVMISSLESAMSQV
jgi:hypothetical protein